jgi:hypothetical protein
MGGIMRNNLIKDCLAVLSLLSLAAAALPAKPGSDDNNVNSYTPSLKSSRVSNDQQYFNGNEWYSAVTNDGQWASYNGTDGAGGSWPRGSNNSVINNAGLWIGFTYDDGTYGMAGVEYGSDFRPGPYGNLDWETNDDYRVYKLNRWDSSTDIDWAEWPVDLGAPYTDSDLNGSYDPATDQPYIPLDQTLFTVYSDSGEHSQFGGSPIGAEIRQTIYGGASSTHNDLSRTFYVKYEIINRGTHNWNNPRFGIWSDVDLGDANNDAIGVDIDSNMVYCYTAESESENDFAGIGPAVGFKYISGLNNLEDNLSAGGCIGNGCTDPNWNYEYDPPADQNQAYNRMLGLQNNGAQIIDENGSVTTFTTTGDPVTGTGWLEFHLEEKQLFLSSSLSNNNSSGNR